MCLKLTIKTNYLHIHFERDLECFKFVFERNLECADFQMFTNFSISRKREQKVANLFPMIGEKPEGVR